jgi:hypothetical protein
MTFDRAGKVTAGALYYNLQALLVQIGQAVPLIQPVEEIGNGARARPHEPRV